jgi:hypothetical protein
MLHGGKVFAFQGGLDQVAEALHFLDFRADGFGKSEFVLLYQTEHKVAYGRMDLSLFPAFDPDEDVLGHELSHGFIGKDSVLAMDHKGCA